MHINVQSADVIRLIQQFLKEQNLNKTLQALQEESGVEFNAVSDIKKLETDILTGKWNVVLEAIKTVQLPKEKLLDLYEQIIIELAENGDVESALYLLKHSPTMTMLKREFTNRIFKLQKALKKYPFDAVEFYTTAGEKQKRREKIMNSIRDEVYSVPSSRLITLLNQSIKWQQFLGALPKGSKLDLLKDCSLVEKQRAEKIINKLDIEIKFGDNKTFAECACFSKDGQFLATGTVDGFIEIWDYETGHLRTDLRYQEQDEFMIHPTAVFCIAFSKDSEKLAIGAKDGQIKVFRLSDGECIEFYSEAHSSSVTSVEFHKDGKQILSASLDFTAKIHGSLSKNTICVFIGHKSFVNSALYGDQNQIITSSSDGTIKLWDSRNASCTKTIVLHKDRAGGVAVTSLLFFPHRMDLLFACSKSSSIHLIKTDGTIVKTFHLPYQESSDETSIVSCATSSLGKFLYCVDEKKILYCFSVETTKLLNAIKSHERDVLGMVHHPHLNLLGTYSLDGSLRIWKAS